MIDIRQTSAGVNDKNKEIKPIRIENNKHYNEMFVVLQTLIKNVCYFVNTIIKCLVYTKHNEEVFV